jgi:hypothetical protein
MNSTDVSHKLSYKQRLQYELIDIDHDLKRLAHVYPQSQPIVDRIRDMLGRCVHLMDGVDTREFCSGFANDGGLE